MFRMHAASPQRPPPPSTLMLRCVCTRGVTMILKQLWSVFPAKTHEDTKCAFVRVQITVTCDVMSGNLVEICLSLGCLYSRSAMDTAKRLWASTRLHGVTSQKPVTLTSHRHKKLEILLLQRFIWVSSVVLNFRTECPKTGRNHLHRKNE
jgi:hypothetical protein